MTSPGSQPPSARSDDCHSADLTVVGVPFHVTANAEVLLAFVETVCAPGLAAPADDEAPPVRLDVRVTKVLPVVPDGAAYRFDHFGTLCHSDGSGLWLTDEGAVGHIPWDQTTAVLSYAPHNNPDTDGLQRVAIVAVIELLRRAGRYQLHASCVARGDKCLLFAGDQRCGKTTAALALARAGWACLADDLVFLHRSKAGDGVAALGWQEHLNVGRPTLDAFGLSEWAEEQRPDGRFSVSPDRAPRPPAGRAYVPSVIVLTTIADAEESMLRPISRGQVLARMIRHSPLALATGFQADEHLAILRDLVSQCDCHELHAGRDVLSGALPDLVAAICGGSV